MSRIHLEPSIKGQTLKSTLQNSINLLSDILLMSYHPYFSQYLHLIYPSALEIKESTDIRRTVSYLDLCLNIDIGGRLHTKNMTKGIILTSQLSIVISLQ